MALNINRTTTTDYSSVADHTIDHVRLDSVSDQEETTYTNDRWAQDWSYFNRIPKLKSAIIMKAIWTVGKGYTADSRTEVILDRITGDGTQTFLDILMNLKITSLVGRDSFAEIIRDEEGNLLNVKILDPSSIRMVYGKNGIIKRYEQMTAAPTKGIMNKIKNVFRGQSFVEFKPEQIFHLPNDKFAGSMHGISVPESVEKIILADDENFNIMRKLTRFQAVPFIIFKVKSDNLTTIENFKANIKEARQNGEDLIIPDDENLLDWKEINLSPSAILTEWRNNLNNQFYQAVGMPLILFGSAGSTESGGKVEYLGHETVFKYNQLQIEKQIEQQLGLSIKLNSPTTLIENLQQDENKDAQNAVRFQQSDVSGGTGR